MDNKLHPQQCKSVSISRQTEDEFRSQIPVNKFNFLHKIVDDKKKEVEHLISTIGITKIRAEAMNCPATRPFSKVLQPLSLIAEVKKASPSKGIIQSDFDPVALAQEFEKAGAAALSVLTEIHHFLGDPLYIQQIKDKVQLPILRKDFLIHPIQVYESRRIGADAILLIKAILTDAQCKDLHELAVSLGLDVLFEIHELEESEILHKMNPLPMIGINNRNLNTFEVNTETAKKLKANLLSSFPNAKFVAESGYATKDDLEDLENEEFSAVLIGEGLIKNPVLINKFNRS